MTTTRIPPMPADFMPESSKAARAIFGSDFPGADLLFRRLAWIRNGYAGPVDLNGNPTDLTECEGCYGWTDETRTDCTNAELCETCMHDHEAECRRCADPGE